MPEHNVDAVSAEAGTSAPRISGRSEVLTPASDATTTLTKSPSNPPKLQINNKTAHEEAQHDGQRNQRAGAEIISEFGPFAESKENEAGRSRATSLSRLSPPKPIVDLPEPTEPPPAEPAATTGNPSIRHDHSASSSIGSGLSSLATFARSLALPKVRSRSVDIVPPPNVVSFNTISSFADQQNSRPTTPSNTSTRQNDSAADASSQTNARSVPNTPNPRKEPPPFDFQLFLDQMKLRSAEPVAKYLRSFLSNFAKKPLAVTEQIKVINEFLSFIAIRMREADVWRNASDEEFDNAMEAMEKLVMNRLYEFTFTPQLAEAQPPRPITTDDLERDRVLAQRIALFGWVEEKHLDVPDASESGGFLMFAQQELLKINHYKAPRDKLICILNCCKVIFGLIRHLHKEENADSFVPILIFVVLKANPPNLISNIEYIQRFRNPQKLQSEAGYYLSSLMGAVQFIETMDNSSLSNISADEFERNVEFAIHDLPASPPQPPLEKPISVTPPLSTQPTTPVRSSSLPALSSLPSTPVRPGRAGPPSPTVSVSNSPHAGEESAQPLSLSLGGLGAGNFADDTRRFLQKTGDAIGKPFNALGRFLGEALDGLDTLPPGSGERRDGVSAAEAQQAGTSATVRSLIIPIQTPYKPRVRPTPPSVTPLSQSLRTGASSTGSTPDSRFGAISTPSRVALGTYPTRPGGELGFGFGSSIPSHLSPHLAEGEGVSRTPTPQLDLAGIQSEIDLAHARAADAALGTLTQIFPAVDREVVEWVLEAEGGDLGRSIEKLLEVGGG